MALTNEQRYLLSRLADEELSAADRVRARRLLMRDPSARAYIAQIIRLKTMARREMPGKRETGAGIARVARRIERP